MQVTRSKFRLSPNLLDSLRDGLAVKAEGYAYACILDSCGLENANFNTDNQSYSLIAGFSDEKEITEAGLFKKGVPHGDGNWYFGHLNYELKDQAEPQLYSAMGAKTGFPDEYLFRADLIILLKDDQLEIISTGKEDPQEFYNSLFESGLEHFQIQTVDVEIFPRNQYLETCEKIQKHLQRGDVYELNYCIPFFTKAEKFQVATCWRELNKNNPAPFSALYRYENSWLLCASPERFLKRTGDKIISQPIKGTARRSADPIIDKKIAEALLHDKKERAENIMITDLVRNDLSRIATRGSVTVEELCGLYSFRHVHQLITTVSARLREDITLKEILTALFPMGSMTGAPKFRAMQLIEDYESFRRELFSGSVGYIAPDGNFDLNVVIRSILYNAATGEVIIPAGSAITAKSDPEKEYEECLLKAGALIRLMQSPATA